MNHQIKKGLKDHLVDGTEFQLGALIDWRKYKLSDLPSEFWSIPRSIKNQIRDGNDDFCASCAGAGERELNEGEVLFYPYLFAAAKFEAKEDPDAWGLTLKQIGKAFTKWGCPKVKDVPPEVLALSYEQRRRFENYPESLRQKAAVHKQKTYFFLDKSPYDCFDSAKVAMWYFRDKKQYVLFGVEFGWGLNEYILDGTPEGFGHAMWASGWDKDGLVVVNSAGEEAGKGGMHRITRDTFNKYGKRFGVMMFVDIPREDVEQYYMANDIKLDDSYVRATLKAIVAALSDIVKILTQNVSKSVGGFVGKFRSEPSITKDFTKQKWDEED